MAEGSKAKYIRELLDRSLDLTVPAMSAEEFEKVFGLKVSAAELTKLTFAEVIVRQLIQKACSGNDRSLTEVLDRLLGKPMQQTESVVKTYTYTDFLIQCRDADAKDVLDVTPKKSLALPERPLTKAEFSKKIAATPVPAHDVLADLL